MPRIVRVLLGATLVVAACTSGGDDAAAPTTAATGASEAASTTTTEASTTTSEAPTTTSPPLDAATWTVQPGWEQVAVLDATPGEQLELVAESGDVIADGAVDDLGSLLFRTVDAGSYEIRSAEATTEPFAVAPLDEQPPPSLYADQRLPAGGYGYIETRDGTTLSANVVLPGPAEAGPYPTVVEYSGYTPSNPNTAGFPQLFNALGYAYVGVNIRGSGCSGGSFLFFEDAQLLDGYDVIETIAAQPWVLGHRVGMVGVSYPGISQLFVASTQPPNLAAITPFSVIADSYRSVIYPGGILNTGFGVEWTQARMNDTRPEGQQWAADAITAGDAECEANQRLRLQNPDQVQLIDENPFYDPELMDPIAPRTLVDQIDVPVLVAGAWQDEQTGANFATMLDRFTGTDHFYATLVNGLHTESIGGGVFPRLVEFLDLYVAQRVPSLDTARGVAPVLASTLFGTDEITLPPDRFTGQTYEQALATFESEPPIQVLFEEGAADGAVPGAPLPRWSQSFDSWPVPGIVATPWYLGPNGALGGETPPTASTTSYTADPSVLPPTYFDEASGQSIWSANVQWQWQQPPAGTAATFTSAPLTTDTVIIGSGSADLWIRTSVEDTDLEVTVTEVRPDGQEVYVQSGWLRASMRALDETASTELRPVQTFLETDAAPLPDGEWTTVRVELLPVAHAFRAGSQIRVTVDAPGNNRGEWVFETIAAGETVEIGAGPEQPSRIMLPVVPGVTVPQPYPTCTMRGQPCRPAAAL